MKLTTHLTVVLKLRMHRAVSTPSRSSWQCTKTTLPFTFCQYWQSIYFVGCKTFVPAYNIHCFPSIFEEAVMRKTLYKQKAVINPLYCFLLSVFPLLFCVKYLVLVITLSALYHTVIPTKACFCLIQIPRDTSFAA